MSKPRRTAIESKAARIEAWADRKIPPQPVPSDVSCPTCSSHQVERQSVGKKAAKFGVFGVLSIVSISKTFKCASCGYTW